VKIVGEQLLPMDLIGNKINLVLNATNLRFYKQKFVLETSIANYELGCDIIDFSSEEENVLSDGEEEVPYPSISELEEMKNEVLEKLNKESEELSQRLQAIENMKCEMEAAKEVDDIIRIYNQVKSAED
jgi:hypothetical protein